MSVMNEILAWLQASSTLPRWSVILISVGWFYYGRWIQSRHKGAK